MKIAILVFDGVDELDFVGPFEVFRCAARLGKKIETDLVSFETKSEITAQFGLTIRSIHTLKDRPDLIIVPGGGWAHINATSGIRNQIQQKAFLASLTQLHKEGTILASVCTGAVALAHAGLLKGRHAATHHSAQEELKKWGVHLVQARVVDDGDIVSSGGVTSSIDLALWIVERFLGSETAAQIANYLEYNRDGNIYVQNKT